MCGICGILERDPARPADRARLRRMTDLLRHRGPDGEGHHIDGPLGLGHRRLSIIDLSDAGRQPMSTPDGQLWISLNGEIYNYQELRAELEAKGHTFRSRTDTEVLLHLYQEEGPDCLSRLIGMFAFAVWDARKHRLFLARDHFGIKPLYYTHTNQTFAFASACAYLGLGLMSKLSGTQLSLDNMPWTGDQLSNWLLDDFSKEIESWPPELPKSLKGPV